MSEPRRGPLSCLALALGWLLLLLVLVAVVTTLYPDATERLQRWR